MWIPIPKAATHSIGAALRERRHCRWTFAVVRYPRSRVESALRSNFYDPALTMLERYERNRDDYHFTPQYHILAPFIERRMLDALGVYERLAEFWERVRAELGVGPLSHLNVSPRDERLTDAEWERIAPRYERDLELYAAAR